jgi:hypothetical protein
MWQGFKNPKGEFLKILEESGGVGENGIRKGDKKGRGGKANKSVSLYLFSTKNITDFDRSTWKSLQTCCSV